MKNHRKIFTSSAAFTLLEMLMVLALAGILMTFASRGFNDVARASSLTATVEQAGDMIVLARQTAVARNLPVEVRFYKLPDFDDATGGATLWRAMHIVIRDRAREESVAPPLFFERLVVIPEILSISPLLVHLGEEQIPERSFGGFSASDVRYKSFLIRPDSTLSSSEEVPSNLWFFTLFHNGASLDGGEVPANFATLQINPVTARVSILRP